MAELEAELEAESAAAAEVDGNETSEAKNDTGERYSIADTIEVDGKQRPTTNSNGQQIHATEEGIRNFWRWFGDSKVVDSQGRPKVLYHGTDEIFTEFRRGDGGTLGDGIYLASSASDAEEFGSVMQVYAKIDNPASDDLASDIESEHGGNTSRELERHGYDGVDGDWEVVAFKSNQIKSATSNTGNFSQDNADIRYSMGDTTVGLTTDPLIKSLVDSGKIVIHDTTDTLPSQRKSGVAGFTAADGTIHVVGNNLPVVLHEAFHSGGKALLGDKRWQNLIRRLESMHKAAKSSDGFWKGAADRVARAGVTGKLAAEEFGAYAIENYDRAPAGVRKWVESMTGAVQAWLYRRFGIQVGKVSAAQLRSLAKAALRSMNEPGPAGLMADRA